MKFFYSIEFPKADNLIFWVPSKKTHRMTVQHILII